MMVTLVFGLVSAMSRSWLVLSLVLRYCDGSFSTTGPSTHSDGSSWEKTRSATLCCSS